MQPKELFDLKCFPYKDEPSDYKNEIRKWTPIISINKIDIPGLNDVFPRAKFVDIEYETFSPASGDKYLNHIYYMKYKNIYYNTMFLNDLEIISNKNKHCKVELEKRISVYSSIVFYDKLKSEIIVDTLKLTKSNSDGESYCYYSVGFLNNGDFYTGEIETEYNSINYISIKELNYSIRLNTPTKDNNTK